jgi:magnesium transporter
MVTAGNEHMISDLVAPDISEMLERRENHQARAALMVLADPEIADVLMALPPQQRAIAFRLLPRSRAADVFTFLPSDQQELLLTEIGSEPFAQIFNEMDPDDRAQVFEEMPGELAAKILALMRPEERRATQVILGYPEDSVGRIMTPDYLTLRPDWTVQQALDHIRRRGGEAETLQAMYVVDDRGRLLDDVSLRQLVLSDPQAKIESLMDGQVVSLLATNDQETAVQTMNRYDLPVLPVLSGDNVLVGIVTFDDVADVAEEEATEDIHKMGGLEALDEPYMSASIFDLVRRRGTWLSALFIGQLLTASAMSHFGSRIGAGIEKVLVLTIFLPLIISSGGNSGSQATTLVIRAMAVREITLRDWLRVFRRELACGLLLGLWLGLLGLVRVIIWQHLGWYDYSEFYLLLGLTVMVSLLGVVIWGTLVGSMLPFIIRRLGFDPAVSSAPFVATLVDVTGLVLYFSVALLFLRNTLLAP